LEELSAEDGRMGHGGSIDIEGFLAFVGDKKRFPHIDQSLTLTAVSTPTRHRAYSAPETDSDTSDVEAGESSNKHGMSSPTGDSSSISRFKQATTASAVANSLLKGRGGSEVGTPNAAHPPP